MDTTMTDYQTAFLRDENGELRRKLKEEIKRREDAESLAHEAKIILGRTLDDWEGT